MRTHDEVRTLLGAYALNAVSPAERVKVARHLEECEDCAHEAEVLEDTAAELAVLPDTPSFPEDLMDRIMDSVPRSRIVAAPLVRTLAAVAAVALLAVGIMGVAFMRERSRDAEFAALVARAQQQVTFESSGEFPARGRLYIADDRVALALDEVPDPGADRAYQLWTLTDGTPVPMETFRPRGGRVAVVMDMPRRGDAFAVTVEPARGSRQPTTDPILVAT
ncbi:MAG TPA: anti-sigma factor [Actinomycetota bacterium]|nr:anti-sigma factor [Actinomycetota bacterium]